MSEGNGNGDRARKPSFVGYQVDEGKDGKSYFNKIGAAFPHKDGKGHTLDVKSMPMNGKIVLRTPQERLDNKRNGAEKGGNGQSQAQERE